MDKFVLVTKKTRTVQRAKAEMSHHKGKVGTHALLTQLLYIIYKREKETRERSHTKMGTEAIGSSCRRSNHTRSTDHRGKTVIVALGLPRAVVTYQQLLIFPMPILGEQTSWQLKS